MKTDYLNYLKETLTRAVNSVISKIEKGEATDQSWLAPIQIITPQEAELPQGAVSVIGCTFVGNDNPALLIDLDGGNILICNIGVGAISITREALEACGWRKEE